MDIELIALINSFRNTISLNNLLIKEKIIRKLEMINTMRYYGFPIMNFPPATSNKIINQLRSIDKEGDIVKYTNATNNTDTNKLLGEILHNAYRASGYNIILSNAPTHGTTVEGDFIQLDCEAIYDTLAQYAPSDSVQAICQIAFDTYLVKIDTSTNAKDLCNLLNEKLLEARIIKVEYIVPLPSDISYTSDINDIDIGETYNSNQNPNPIETNFTTITNSNTLSSAMGDIDVIRNKNTTQSYFTWFLDIMSGLIQYMKYFRWMRR